MRTLLSQQWFWSACLLVVVGDMIFVHLGLTPLIDPDEGRNASIAWEMKQAGNWLIPVYDGLPYMDKPAFFFKSVALALSVFGHNEFAARLPSALSAAGLLALVFLFCRKQYDVRTAAMAVAVIATTPLFFSFAHYVIFDMMLALAVCCAVFAGYNAEFEEGLRRENLYRWAAVAIGIAVLIKGPVGFILPVLILAIFFRVERRKGACKRLLCKQTWMILALIIMPWFIGASYLRPDFPYYGIVRESLARFTTHDFKRDGPFYYYLPVIALSFFPWSLLLPEAAWGVWRKRLTLSRADRLFIVWIIATVIFFSLSQSKLPGYILTVAVASGVLTARLFAHALTQCDAAKIVRRGFLFFFALMLAALLGVLIVDLHPVIIQSIHLKNSDTRTIIRSASLPVTMLLALSVLAGAGALDSKKSHLIFAAFLVPLLLIPAVLFPAYAMTEQYRSDKSLARETAIQSQGNEVACLGCFPSGMPFTWVAT